VIDGNVYPQDSKVLQPRSRSVRGTDVHLEELDRIVIVADRNSRFDTADVGFRQAERSQHNRIVDGALQLGLVLPVGTR